jgi:hypothetical protein
MGDRVVTMLAIGRVPTLVGWTVLASVFAALVLTSVVTRGGFPSGVALLRVVTRRVGLRVVAVLGWVWLGWHLFVRTSR